MVLKSIEQHKAEVYHLLKNGNLTGIECPNCKTEMQFKSHMLMLSSPPQKDIVCFECGYETRIPV